MVVGFASADFIHYDPGIGQGVCYSHLDRQITDLQGCLLDAGKTANRLEVNRFQLFAGQHFNHCSQCGFHNTAGRTEDYTRTGCDTKWRVIFFRRNGGKIDAGFLDHPGQFTGGQHKIDVLHSVVAELRPDGFSLLGRTGHDRN